MRGFTACSHPSLLVPRARSQGWEARTVLPDSRGIISGVCGHPSPRQGQQRGTGSHAVTGVRHPTQGFSPKADPLAGTAASTIAKPKGFHLKPGGISMAVAECLSIN